MARKPRIYYPGAIYHVMLRGNHCETIFFSNEDRVHFLYLLQEGIKRYEHHIHAFCFMNNHVHLAIQVENESLSKIIHNLSFRYTQFINRKFERVGHLFQGRFKAILVDRDNYLLQLVRYIHLNPLRANLIKNLEDYFWSSHRAYLGLETIPWLTTQTVLNIFSINTVIAKNQYQQFLHDSDEIISRQEFKTGNQEGYEILGCDYFMQTINKKIITPTKPAISLDQLIEVICQYYSVNSSSLKSSFRDTINAEIRSVIAWIAQEMYLCDLTTVARYLHRDSTNISKSIRRLLDNEKSRDKLIQIKNNIEKSLLQF